MEIKRNGRKIEVEFIVNPCPLPPGFFFSEEKARRVKKEADTNPWAWADITIIAHLQGDDVPQGTAHLRRCNYKNEEDFQNGPSFDWIVETAVQDLLAKIQSMYRLMGEERRRWGY
jgi:hypothetical protein